MQWIQERMQEVAFRQRPKDWERYDGIDGYVWPDLTPDDHVDVGAGIASLRDLDRAIAYFRRIAMSDDWKLFFCQCDPRGVSLISPGPHFEFCGYDYALPPDEYNDYCYSSILNEVVLGSCPTLVEFGALLNQHLLFDKLETCEPYECEHRRLLEIGENVEVDDPERPFVPTAVWLWRDPSGAQPAEREQSRGTPTS
jgi:hypothetical protein